MQQGTPSRISRRTLTRGAAWAAPTVALAAAAPAFASSPGQPPCVPTFTFKVNESCKCPGNSTAFNSGYFLKICVTNTSTCPLPVGTTVEIVSVHRKGNGSALASAPQTPYCTTLPETVVLLAANGGEVCTDFLRMDGSNSGNFLYVAYRLNGGALEESADIASPPECGTSGTPLDKCNQAGSACP